MLIKIKEYFDTKRGADLALGTLLILAMTVSFMLGRLSKEAKNAIIVEGVNAQEAEINPTEYTIDNAQNIANSEGDGSIVASSRGSKYYYVWCSGAKSLSATNKIYFKSESEAEKAGYSLSTTCEK